MGRITPYIAFAALVFAVARPCSAQSSATVTAREVAKQGLDDYDAGRYESAAKKLLQAYEVVRVPTLAVYTARALAKTGRLVQASELYLEAQRIKPKPDWPAIQAKMQQEAKRARMELLERIPRVKIQVERARIEDVKVTVDGVVIANSLLSQEQLVDPGKRELAAACGREHVTKRVTLREGVHATVSLGFSSNACQGRVGQKAADVKATGGKPSQSAAAESPSEDEPANATNRLLGWFAAGVGAAGVGVGAVSGLVASSKRSTLQDEGKCDENSSCYKDYQADVDAYNALLTASTVGFIVGGIGLAGGLTLLLTTPSESTPATALQLGPRSLMMRGVF